MMTDNKKQLAQDLSAQNSAINNQDYIMEQYLLGINEQTLTEYRQGYQSAHQLYQQPVRQSTIPTDDTWDEDPTDSSTEPRDQGYYNIGNWSSENEELYKLRINTKNFTTEDLDTVNASSIKEMPASPRQTLPHKNISIQLQDNTQASAKMNFYTNSIVFNRYSDNIKNRIEQQGKTSHIDEYIKGNPTAEYTTYYHEKVHSDHYNYDGMGELLKTPQTAIKSHRLTETVAYAAEYLAATKLYHTLKEQNIKTTEYNGKTIPITNILTQYPGLKEVIDKNGSDLNNKENIRAIVQVSAEHWNKERKNSYAALELQQASLGNKIFNSLAYSEQLETLKNQDTNYKIISSYMLKGIDIGQNTTVDLSCCRDLLDTMNDKEASLAIEHYNQNLISTGSHTSQKISIRTYAEMKAIDDHLTALGLTTDTEKMKYMADYLNSIAHRDNKINDTELTAIINTYNPQTIYADGLEQTLINNRSIIIKDGKYYDMSATPENKTRNNEKTSLNTAITELSQCSTDNTKKDKEISPSLACQQTHLQER